MTKISSFCGIEFSFISPDKRVIFAKSPKQQGEFSIETGELVGGYFEPVGQFMISDWISEQHRFIQEAFELYKLGKDVQQVEPYLKYG